MTRHSVRADGPDPSGTGVGLIIDLAPETVRAYFDGAVVREPAAVLVAEGRLVTGAEAARRSGEAPEAFDPRIPEAIDQEFLVLGGLVVGYVDALRALLRGTAARAGSFERGAPRIGEVTVAVPQPWGGVRRGVVERAAAALAERVLVVGSSVAGHLAAVVEGAVGGSGSAVVIEQWPDCAVASLVAGRPEAGCEPDSAAVEPGIVMPGDGVAEAGVCEARVLDDLAMRAGDRAGRLPMVALPRGGWEFDRRGGARWRRVVRLDSDAVLRGACRWSSRRGNACGHDGGGPASCGC